jgi:YVTN family beta-propeller protein
VGKRPTDIAITPDGQKVYVTNFYDNTVSVIETANDTVKETIDVGKAPVGVLITPDGSKVYVANSVGKSLSVIDAANDTVETIPLRVKPWSK